MSAETVIERLREALPDAGVSLRKNPGPSCQHSLLVNAASLLDVCNVLRDTLAFDLLSNVTGVDFFFFSV